MIKAVHLDDRLIHGQVAISWTRSLGADVLLVINDEIVNNPTRKNALKLGVPAGVKYGFRSVKDGIDFLNGPDSQKYKIMALINNPIDAFSRHKFSRHIWYLIYNTLQLTTFSTISVMCIDFYRTRQAWIYVSLFIILCILTEFNGYRDYSVLQL